MDSALLAGLASRWLLLRLLVLVLAAAPGCARPPLAPVESVGAWRVRAITIAGEEPLRSQELLSLEIDDPRPAGPGQSRIALRELAGSGRVIDAETLRAIVRAIAQDYAQRGEGEVHADILRSDLDALLTPDSSGTLVIRIRRGSVARSGAR